MTFTELRETLQRAFDQWRRHQRLAWSDLGQAARRAGTDPADLQSAVGKMGEYLAGHRIETAAALDQLGVRGWDDAGQPLDAVKVTAVAARRLAGRETTAREVALALQLWGRRGTELLHVGREL